MFIIKKKNFQLETKEIEIKIFPKNFLFPFFLIFHFFKSYSFFRQIFKFVLKIPHYLLVSNIGTIFTSIAVIWAFAGREPYSMIFCWLYLAEVICLILTLKYLLHIEGVYDYCLLHYGPEFMEYYVGNPWGQLTKRVLGYGALGTSAFLAGEASVAHNHYNYTQDLQAALDWHKSMGHDLTISDGMKIRDQIRTNNTSNFDKSLKVIVEHFDTKKK